MFVNKIPPKAVQPRLAKPLAVTLQKKGIFICTPTVPPSPYSLMPPSSIDHTEAHSNYCLRKFRSQNCMQAFGWTFTHTHTTATDTVSAVAMERLLNIYRLARNPYMCKEMFMVQSENISWPGKIVTIFGVSQNLTLGTVECLCLLREGSLETYICFFIKKNNK